MGNSRVDAPYKTFTAGEALEPFRRVKLGANGKTVVYADAGDRGIGTVIDQRVALGEPVTVKLDNGGGTVLMTVGGDVADKGVVYAAADGKVAATGGVPVGYLLDPADQAADGAALEVVPFAQASDEFFIKHTVTSGEAAANSGDGQVDIQTNFGAAPAFRMVQLLTASTGLVKTGYDVVDLTSNDAGKVRVNGNAAGTQVDENDVIVLWARRTI